MSFRRYLTLFWIFLLIGSAKAQTSQELFGKNRIQYKAIHWKVLESERFEIYYYGDNYDLARIAATYGESDLNRITSLLSYSTSQKIKIVLYNSVTDQLQSNIGLNNDELLIGGQTVLVKSKVEVAFRGTQYQFMEDISYGIAHILIDNMMLGGSLKEVVKSSYLMHLPDWFMLGAPSHIGAGWSQEMDDYIRDLAYHKKLRNPGSYRGNEAKLVGHSVFNFIEREYSTNDLSVVIGYTKIFRDIEESIEAALGISYPEFIRNWKKFYASQNGSMEEYYSLPEDSVVISKSGKYRKITQLEFNNEGSKLAWVSNKRGRYKVTLLDLNKNKKQTLYRKGYRRLDQPVDYATPVIAWQDDNNLSFVFNKKLAVYLKSKNITNGKGTTILLPFVRQVFSFSYGQNGNAVLSADKYGKTDLFYLSGGALKQITNDFYDDLNPVLIGNDIYFSSNRFSDTLNAYSNGLPSYSELFHLYKLKPGKNVVEKIPTEGNCVALGVYKNQLLYISDETGIAQLHTSNEGKLISKNIQDYKVADIAETTGRLAYVSRRDGNDIIGLENINLIPTKVEFTPRKKFVNAALGKFEGGENVTNFSSDEEINLDQVIFEGDVRKDSSLLLPPAPILPSFMVPMETSNGKPYHNAMSGEKVNSTLLVDPIRGMGLQVEGGMSDLLGNHKINAGAFLSFDFRSNKIFGEYQYLQRRFDFKVRYDRQGIFAINDYQVIHRYIMNTISGSISYPFSPYHRISVTPGLSQTRYGELTDLSAIADKDQLRYYQHVRGEYVFDNSLITGMNMLKGTKAKITYEAFGGNRPFQVYNIDIRKYIPIHKELTLALRASHGGFLGKYPKNFLLGGMDNWILSNRQFYSTINNGPYNPLVIEQGVENSDLLFLRYATSMRGFGFQSQFGNNYVLFNVEGRLPIIQYFSNGTIGSSFLRNLQFVAFMDAGSAYDGKNPFSTENSQNTKDITGYPFYAIVKNYRSPFLYGYGGGVRTLLFGYYVKFDVAVGVKDGIKQKTQAYLTFGYDF